MRRSAVVVAVLALVLGACSSGSDESVNTSEGLIVEAEPTPETFDPTDSDQLAGVSTRPNLIDAGDCFNEYIYTDRSDFLQQITTIVNCNGPHDREAYFVAEYPGDEDEPAPAEEALRRWASNQCLEEFEDFVGLEYVLSKLEIGAIIPTFETWTDEGDRKVICYVYPDEDNRRLRSSVRNSGL